MMDRRHRLALSCQRLVASGRRYHALAVAREAAGDEAGWAVAITKANHCATAADHVCDLIIRARTWNDDPADIDLSRWAARQGR